jgi:hypothetical protein
MDDVESESGSGAVGEKGVKDEDVTVKPANNF